MDSYSIKNIITFRELKWNYTEDFLFLTDIPESFEPFILTPDYFSYGIINKGQLVVELDGELLHIDNKKRSFFIYRPHQNLKIVEISPGTQGAFVLFNKKFIQTLDNHFLSITEKTFLESRFGTYYSLKSKDFNRLQDLFSKIFDLLSFINSELWEQTAKNLMLVLISETDLVISKYRPSSKQFTFNRSHHLVESFMRLVSENYLHEQNLDYYAFQLNITVNYLHKIVQNSLNITPSKIIQNAILDQSILLLKNSDNNIGEIAEKLSFKDIYSFSKFFKKNMNVSPKKYRNQLAAELQ
jgi:AraC-like DNA-binding protein